MANEEALTTEEAPTVWTPYGQARRCNGISKTTQKRCAKAALRHSATCAIHGVAGSGCWSKDSQRQDPRLFPAAGGAYRAPPVEVMMAFLAAQERTVRISKQAAVVDSISIELVQGLLEGVVQLIATFVPGEREVEALGALFDFQASLLPGVVRL
jgi:hypothetical protein